MENDIPDPADVSIYDVLEWLAEREVFKTDSELSVGDKILVFGELETVIERIEGDSYYFKDEDGEEWKEDKDAIRKL